MGGLGRNPNRNREGFQKARSTILGKGFARSHLAPGRVAPRPSSPGSQHGAWASPRGGSSLLAVAWPGAQSHDDFLIFATCGPAVCPVGSVFEMNPECKTMDFSLPPQPPPGPVTIILCPDHYSHLLSGCPSSLFAPDSPFSTPSQIGSFRI